jgi:hypothetical protein
MNAPMETEVRRRRLALALLIPAFAVMLLAFAAECWRVLDPAEAQVERRVDPNQ